MVELEILNLIGQGFEPLIERKGNMTCIIALKHENKVYMGTDSAITDGNGFVISSKDSKISKIKDKYLLGVAGPRSIQNIILLPDNLNKIFKDNISIQEIAISLSIGLEPIPNSDQCQLLLTDGDSIVRIVRNEWSEHTDYFSIGNGYLIAMGALYSSTEDDPKNKIRIALKASAHFMNNIREPFYFYDIG